MESEHTPRPSRSHPGHGHASQLANQCGDGHLAEGARSRPQEWERGMKAFLHLPWVVTGSEEPQRLPCGRCQIPP